MLYLSILFVFFTIVSYAKCSELIDSSNNTCTSAAINNTFHLLLSNRSLEPIHGTQLKGVMSNINCVLYDPTLNGFSSCKPASLTVRDETHEIILKCPSLNLTSNFTADGAMLVFFNINIKGYMEITIEDAIITLKGKHNFKNKKNETFLNVEDYAVITKIEGKILLDKVVAKKKDQSQANTAKSYLNGKGQNAAHDQVTQWVGKMLTIVVEQIKDSFQEVSFKFCTKDNNI